MVERKLAEARQLPLEGGEVSPAGAMAMMHLGAARGIAGLGSSMAGGLTATAGGLTATPSAFISLRHRRTSSDCIGTSSATEHMVVGSGPGSSTMDSGQGSPRSPRDQFAAEVEQLRVQWAQAQATAVHLADELSSTQAVAEAKAAEALEQAGLPPGLGIEHRTAPRGRVQQEEGAATGGGWNRRRLQQEEAATGGGRNRRRLLQHPPV